MPALRSGNTAHGHAHRAAHHRRDLPPPGAGQIQFQRPSGARSTAGSCAATCGSRGGKKLMSSSGAGRFPIRYEVDLGKEQFLLRSRPMPSVTTDRDRAAAAGRGQPAQVRLDRLTAGAGRRAAARERRCPDAPGRDRGAHAERHAGLLQESRSHGRSVHS